jgi:hypothetical protein
LLDALRIAPMVRVLVDHAFRALCAIAHAEQGDGAALAALLLPNMVVAAVFLRREIVKRLDMWGVDMLFVVSMLRLQGTLPRQNQQQ